MARQPTPPSRIWADIPEIISKISLKLLEKNPEDRYQSAFGLLLDLRRCRQEYTAESGISSFALGNWDAPEKLQLSQKLVGREEALEKLLDIFEKVKAGSFEIFNITGYAGIGKTRLIEELRQPVREAGGYFGSGKYDPFHRDAPYSAIIAAFQDIIKQILRQSPERLADWKKRFLNALDPHGQLFIGFIPELELF